MKNFPNSADPEELPQALLRFIRTKGTELLSICSLDAFFFFVFWKIIFLSFLLYLTTTGRGMWQRSRGRFTSRMLHPRGVNLPGSPGLVIFYYFLSDFHLNINNGFYSYHLVSSVNAFRKVPQLSSRYICSLFTTSVCHLWIYG